MLLHNLVLLHTGSVVDIPVEAAGTLAGAVGNRSAECNHPVVAAVDILVAGNHLDHTSLFYKCEGNRTVVMATALILVAVQFD